MDWRRLAMTVRRLFARAVSFYAALERRMNRRRWIFAGLALLLLLALALALQLRRSWPAGQTVHMIRPAVTAIYYDKGKLARDDEALYGMTAVVVGGENPAGYLPVWTEYGYRANMHKGDVSFSRDVTGAWQTPHTHVVAGQWADVMREPELKSYPPLLTLPRGAKVRVAAADGDYARIVLHNGAIGHVRLPLLREKRAWDPGDESAMRRRVVEDALAYRGVPYRWGGKTPTGIDCSGLTSMAYMMNGLAIHRNSSARAGFPIALMHVDTPPGGHTRESLAAVKPGDMIYWQGHQGVYLSGGRYVHANSTSYDVAVNSLVKGDDDYREDLALPGAILAWGTAFPARPEAITIRQFVAVPTGEKGKYRFFARIDGYAPTTATIYPEGMGAGNPVVVVADPTRMVCGAMEAGTAGAPEHTYAKPGAYRPVVVLANIDGWLPKDTAITSEPFEMEAIEVRF